jgi:hypothetical protein
VAAVCREDRGSSSREYSPEAAGWQQFVERTGAVAVESTAGAVAVVRTGSVVAERTCRGRGGSNRVYIAEEAVDKDRGSRSREYSPEAGVAVVLKNTGVVGAGV